MLHIPTPSEVCSEAVKTPEFDLWLSACVEELHLGTLRRVYTSANIAVVVAVMRALRERGWVVKLAYDDETCSSFIHLSFPEQH